MKLTPRGLTKIILIVVTIAVIAYDIAIIVIGGADATISRVILNWSQQAPILPFAVGYLNTVKNRPQYFFTVVTILNALIQNT